MGRRTGDHEGCGLMILSMHGVIVLTVRLKLLVVLLVQVPVRFEAFDAAVVAQVLRDLQAQAYGALQARLSLRMNTTHDTSARYRAPIPSSPKLIVPCSLTSLVLHLIQSHLSVIVPLDYQIRVQSDAAEDGISSGKAKASWLQG